jgi:hypothetical protein
VRHFVDERLGQPEMTAATCRRVSPSEGNLLGYTGSDPGSREPGGALGGALRGIECHRDPRLRGGQRSLRRLKDRDELEPVGVKTNARVDTPADIETLRSPPIDQREPGDELPELVSRRRYSSHVTYFIIHMFD